MPKFETNLSKYLTITNKIQELPENKPLFKQMRKIDVKPEFYDDYRKKPKLKDVKNSPEVLEIISSINYLINCSETETEFNNIENQYKISLRGDFAVATINLIIRDREGEPTGKTGLIELKIKTKLLNNNQIFKILQDKVKFGIRSAITSVTSKNIPYVVVEYFSDLV
jgi:hypothetical protein